MDDLKELERLILAANKNLQSEYITIGQNKQGRWYLCRTGSMSKDLFDATFTEAIARLREWAKPKTVTVTIDVQDAEDFAHRAWAPDSSCSRISERVRVAIKEANGES